ncbi:MAG: hypothetical protein HYZ37_03510 [Candidatus Solibacter usitatus]|nr:hypothetical protein [Candidatus Solibacter usitatus]
MKGSLAAGYLLSLPERVVRSLTALAGGLVREAGDVVLPGSLRRTRLYRSLVSSTLRFLIERIGEVEGTYPSDTSLASDFLARRAAGNGIEFASILLFRASPVWVLAALADLSGSGRHLIQEISASWKEQGLLDKNTNFETMDQVLDGLEKTAGQAAETINMPPLEIAQLREDLRELRKAAATLPSPRLPSMETVERQWAELQQAAKSENRPVWELSAVMAMAAVRGLPNNLLWISRCVQDAAKTTGNVIASGLLDHYGQTLSEIRKSGYLAYWAKEFRPYLAAASAQFSPSRQSLTQRLLKRS